MFDPNTWSGIAEKVGVPFALCLLVFMFLGVMLIWIGNKIVLPLITSVRLLLASVMKWNKSNGEQVKKQTRMLQKLVTVAESHGEQLKSFDQRLQHIEQVATDQSAALLAHIGVPTKEQTREPCKVRT